MKRREAAFSFSALIALAAVPVSAIQYLTAARAPSFRRPSETVHNLTVSGAWTYPVGMRAVLGHNTSSARDYFPGTRWIGELGDILWMRPDDRLQGARRAIQMLRSYLNETGLGDLERWQLLQGWLDPEAFEFSPDLLGKEANARLIGRLKNAHQAVSELANIERRMHRVTKARSEIKDRARADLAAVHSYLAYAAARDYVNHLLPALWQTIRQPPRDAESWLDVQAWLVEAARRIDGVDFPEKDSVFNDLIDDAVGVTTTRRFQLPHAQQALRKFQLKSRPPRL